MEGQDAWQIVQDLNQVMFALEVLLHQLLLVQQIVETESNLDLRHAMMEGKTQGMVAVQLVLLKPAGHVMGEARQNVPLHVVQAQLIYLKLVMMAQTTAKAVL